MSKKSRSLTLVYPALGSVRDLWFVRMSGSGLGNAFYNYFQAVALADQCDATVIVPPWFSVKIGPMLRGQSGKRFYLAISALPAAFSQYTLKLRRDPSAPSAKTTPSVGATN